MTSDFAGSLEHAHDDILNAVAAKEPIEYSIKYDLEMIVRCVFHVEHPCKYATLLRTLAARESESSSDTEVIKRFWNENIAGFMWVKMVRAAREADYSGLKGVISAMFFHPKSLFKVNDDVDVFWLGNDVHPADWYTAKVIAVSKDSYTIRYTEDNTEVNAHSLVASTSP